MPSKISIEDFWKPLYETEKSYNKEAQWIKDYENSLEINKNIFHELLITEVKSSIRNFGLWKSPGIDNLQNYWWHKFTSSHETLTKIYNNILRNPAEAPTWLFSGITRLAPKKSETKIQPIIVQLHV